MKEPIHKYYGLSGLPTGRAKDIVEEGCLVIEGGAFRGLYNQGVMDAMMLCDINLQTVIGISAGALAGMNYVSGQIGRSARANLTYRHDSRYVGIKAYKNCHSILDVDFLFHVYEKTDPLDLDRLLNSGRRFVCAATSCADGTTKYFDKDNCSDIQTAIKASATMPFISPMVDVDGMLCMDGGCSCSIAYQWALDQGFEKIVIIKTRERGYRKEEKIDHMALKVYKDYPEFARKLSETTFTYNRELTAVDELEKSGRAYVIAPSQHVTVGRVERSMDKLGDLYWLGFNDAVRHMKELRNYLGITI